MKLCDPFFAGFAMVIFMIRQDRIDMPGALHHIICRGIEQRQIFFEDADRDRFVGRIDTLCGIGSDQENSLVSLMDVEKTAPILGLKM